MTAPRVLIIANNLLARVGLAALLREQTEVEVVGQLADTPPNGGSGFLADLDIYEPEVVVYDLGYDPMILMPRLAQLVETQIPIVALIPHEDTARPILNTLAEGDCYGLLLRDSEPDLLAAAIQAVYTGLIALEPSLTTPVISVERSNSATDGYPVEDLTPRENEVLQLLASGLPNKTIAVALGISPNTVKFHVNAILSKLNAQSRTEAAVRAAQMGLLML